jgi:hypothetical protein
MGGAGEKARGEEKIGVSGRIEMAAAEFFLLERASPAPVQAFFTSILDQPPRCFGPIDASLYS